MTTNRRRRGGQKGKIQQRRDVGLIGTLIHYKLKESGQQHFVESDIQLALNFQPFSDDIKQDNYNKDFQLQCKKDKPLIYNGDHDAKDVNLWGKKE